MFKNTKTKISAVLTVLAVLCAGVVIVGGSEDSEAVTVQTPIASLVKDADDVYTDYNSNGITSYTVAEGTYVEITHVVGADYAYEITAVTSSYGDTAGLAYTSPFNHVAGYINKSASGTISISVEFRDTGGENEITITLNVVDTSSSSSNLWSTISLPANVFGHIGPAYAYIGTTVSVTHSSFAVSGDSINYTITDVTSGFGLTIDSNHDLSGTITAEGTITVEVTIDDGVDETFQYVTINVPSNHADVRMIGGETWTYTPTFNLAGTISLSGTASAWCSESAGTITGTAPTGTAIGATYDLTITLTSTNPAQTATQTVTFTVDPQITVSGPGATQSISYGSGSTTDLISSNYDDGTRSIYSVTGGTASGFSVVSTSGVINYTNPSPGTVIVTATSPYSYTSGATNSASVTITFDVQGVLSASVSGTLYLVTNKTVPNTPAENVTLSHNDVGAGTYTWAVEGTNNSGVTVASDGTLGGTPGDVGTYSVTVRCTSDVSGIVQTADATLNIVIVNVLVFTSTPSQGTVS